MIFSIFIKNHPKWMRRKVPKVLQGKTLKAEHAVMRLCVEALQLESKRRTVLFGLVLSFIIISHVSWNQWGCIYFLTLLHLFHKGFFVVKKGSSYYIKLRKWFFVYAVKVYFLCVSNVIMSRDVLFTEHSSTRHIFNTSVSVQMKTCQRNTHISMT